MILNSRNNNFIVRFNRGWFYPDIVSKYETYLKRLPLPYENLQDYMTASIQAITFPSLSQDSVEQVLYEDPISAKGGKRPIWYLDRSFNITFKSYEGFINYWVFFDMFFAYMDLDQKDKYLKDINLTFLDQTGFEFLSVNFSQIQITSVSELELNYSSNTAEFRTFNVGFKYNFIDVQKRLQ